MIDFNAKLGHWPYRPVRGVDALLHAMDELGIERAVVSSLSAVHYFNPQDGNDEVVRWVAPHRDRLIPFAVLKPGFFGVLDDLHRCLDDYGMQGLVLHPNYHRFSLESTDLDRFMLALSEIRKPVCVQAGLEDVRRQFDRERVEDVPVPALSALLRRYPENPIVALGLKWGQPELLGEPLPPNAYFDTSHYEGLNELEAAVSRWGAERLLFSTDFPLLSPRANVDKFRVAELDAAAKEAIARGNARRLLGC